MVVEVTEPSKVTGPGDASGFIFSFSPMVIYKSSDMVVTHVVISTGVETPLTEGTGAANYSVTVAEYPGTGSVTYPADLVTPMTADEKIVMKPIMPLEQQADLNNQGGYHADTQEIMHDKSLKVDRQQQEELDRSVKLPVSVSVSFDAETPAPVALSVLHIAADGLSFAWSTIVSLGAAILSDLTPTALTGTPAAGTSGEVSRADHDHGNHFEGHAEIGDPGFEAAGIDIGGVVYTHGLRINDLDGSNPAEFILHRHSTTIEPLRIGARSNSDGSGHAAVTVGQGTLADYGAGWTGTEYNMISSIKHVVGTGTINDTSSPGMLLFRVTADGAVTPTTAMTIDSDKSVTFAGTFELTGERSGLASTGLQVDYLASSTIVRYNVPTSIRHEFQVNGVGYARLGSTSIFFGNIAASNYTTIFAPTNSSETLRFKLSGDTSSQLSTISWTNDTGTTCANIWATGDTTGPLRLKSSGSIELHTNDVGITGAAGELVIDTGGDTRPGTDNTHTLGVAAHRWSEIFCANATINTSDIRNKQDQAALTEAEKSAALAIKASIQTFRWVDAVAEKGEAARTHVGVMAQTVIQIMEDHGLDAMKYGFICYDEWDEEVTEAYAIEQQVKVTEQQSETSVEIVGGVATRITRLVDVEVPKVNELPLFDEAGEPVMDNGVQVTHQEPVVELVEFPRQVTREAGSRYGVRYSQLLAFIAGS